MEALLTDTLVWKRKAPPTVLGFNSRELCIFTFPKAAEDTFRVYELDVSFAFALSLYTRMKSHLPLYLEIFSISLFVPMNLYHFQSLFVWLFVFSHKTLVTLQNTPWILCLCLDYISKSSKQQYSQTLTNNKSTKNVYRRDRDVLLNTRDDELQIRVPLIRKTKLTSILPPYMLGVWGSSLTFAFRLR